MSNSDRPPNFDAIGAFDAYLFGAAVALLPACLLWLLCAWLLGWLP